MIEIFYRELQQHFLFAISITDIITVVVIGNSDVFAIISTLFCRQPSLLFLEFMVTGKQHFITSDRMSFFLQHILPLTRKKLEGNIMEYVMKCREENVMNRIRKEQNIPQLIHIL